MDAEFQRYMDRLRSAVRLSDYLRRSLRLERRGREWAALCPFHEEKTPSFYVNDEKNFYHCFGCGAHGDAIGFLMQREGLRFIEAVERLGTESGLGPPPRRKPASPEAEREQDERVRLGAMLEEAAAWFSARLFEPGGREALAYLREARGVGEATAAAFRLGLAPEGGEPGRAQEGGGQGGGLLAHLRARGWGERDQVAGGLARRGEDGDVTPFFRRRIIFPIEDRRGKIVSFGGRALSPRARAKYLNGPETALFAKKRTLYNFPRAAEALRRAAVRPGQGTADGTGTADTAGGGNGAGSVPLCVVEGYMDAVALFEAGVETAVAPLGTALGEEQLALLWRAADEPVLCFDGDEAGRRAALRAAERALPLLAPGRSLRFALLPAGEDPDSLVRRGGASAFLRLAAAGEPLMEVLWQSLARGRSLATPERRALLERETESALARIQDPAVRRAYEREYRGRLRNLEYEARRAAARAERAEGGAGRAAAAAAKSGARAGPAWSFAGRTGAAERGREAAAARATLARNRARREERLLALALGHPWLLAEYAEPLAALQGGAWAGVRRALLEAADEGADLDPPALIRYLQTRGFPDIPGESAGGLAAAPGGDESVGGSLKDEPGGDESVGGGLADTLGGDESASDDSAGGAADEQPGPAPETSLSPSASRLPGGGQQDASRDEIREEFQRRLRLVAAGEKQFVAYWRGNQGRLRRARRERQEPAEDGLGPPAPG